jgi:aryl-alcohol dehydrogenase-like predicted oxidoreductase
MADTPPNEEGNVTVKLEVQVKEPSLFADNHVSRLMLGTAQFGLPYGVANRTGQPDYATVRAIVVTALDGGVNAFDTAAGYGTSEEVLGRVLHELGVADRVVVVTKVRPLTPGEIVDADAAAEAIAESVDTSRQRLRLDCLPVVMFHREADAIHLPQLEALKAKGCLRHAGVSCDNRPGPASDFATIHGVDALQLPANILDQRHVRAGSIAAAATHGVAVFVRGTYLQGLLLMPENAIPHALQGIVPVRRTLEAIAGEAGMSMAEMSLRYLLGQPGITSVLTGVETVSQICENLALLNLGPLAADIMAAIDAAVPDLPETILTPSLWDLSGKCGA